MSDYMLISMHTKSYTVAFGADTGTVRTKQYAMIESKRGIREYEVSEHKGCPNGGLRFVTMEAYSNDSHCTGCDLYEYDSIGD